MYDFYYETLLKDSRKFGAAAESLQNTIIELTDSREVSILGAQHLNVKEPVK